jgi:hypothetical protein
MALAEYFQRSAVAAAQILSGFDEGAIARRLEGVRIGISAEAESAEGRACAEMAVRLLARLYPYLGIEGSDAEELRRLALSINPRIELTEGACDHTLCIGTGAGSGRLIHIGSAGWDAHLSTTEVQPVGDSENPLGGGVAACLGAAALFRSVFLGEEDSVEQLTFSALELEPRASRTQPLLDSLEIPADTALVGLGAIGNGVLWTLARSPIGGSLTLVDPEKIELGNLQRYVMSASEDVGRSKVELGSEVLGGLETQPRAMSWERFVAEHGHRWQRVLVALDTAADRRQVQDALPRWIANAWTQPGDLGVSVHPWRRGGCLACLYLRPGEVPNEDEQVAEALGVPGQRQEVRRLLVGQEPTPPELLEEAASALGIEPEPLLAFEGRPLREIYVEGICGGKAVPLDRIGLPAAEVHVPLAHQSALAGILLVARLVGELLGEGPAEAEATRLDLIRPIPAGPLTQPLAKDARGICICQDEVFQAAYEEKWPARAGSPSGSRRVV